MSESAEEYYVVVIPPDPAPEFSEGRLYMGLHEEGADKKCECGDTLFDHRQIPSGVCMFCKCFAFKAAE